MDSDACNDKQFSARAGGKPGRRRQGGSLQSTGMELAIPPPPTPPSPQPHLPLSTPLIFLGLVHPQSFCVTELEVMNWASRFVLTRLWPKALWMTRDREREGEKERERGRGRGRERERESGEGGRCRGGGALENWKVLERMRGASLPLL